MSALKIKICGINEPDMAAYAAKAGANYIGLIFHPSSPRHIHSLTTAKAIANASLLAGATPVAVFIDQTAQEMRDILNVTGITTIQLHGAAAKSEHVELSNDIKRFYAVAVESDGNYRLDTSTINLLRDSLLFDYKDPGKGQSFDQQKFNYQGKFPYFIAGGLSANNVQQCVAQLKPDGVDVSSKLETHPGVKDPQLIQQFIASARHG